ncbi:MAG: hypothetical protein ACOC8H_00100 [bacterium]
MLIELKPNVNSISARQDGSQTCDMVDMVIGGEFWGSVHVDAFCGLPEVYRALCDAESVTVRCT